MTKETLITYLDKQLTKKITEYDTAIDWDAKNHTIELVIRLFAENAAGTVIDDAEGVESEEEIIEFEDGILFYNPQKSRFDEEDYLAVIPYEGKKGIQQIVIDGLVDYLQEVLDQGQSDLLDFLSEENEDEFFELQFSEEALDQAIEKYEEKGYLPYPSY
jgi:DNA-3-methyladenine glycosylase